MPIITTAHERVKVPIGVSPDASILNAMAPSAARPARFRKGEHVQVDGSAAIPRAAADAR